METTEPDQNTPQQPGDNTWQAEIIARCLAGDETAFALLVEQYGSLLLRTAYLLIGDDEAAKDITQNALIQAWKHMHQLHEPSALRAWLIKIVVNQSTSLKRQLARRASFMREQQNQHVVEEAILHSDFQRGRVEEELDLLEAIKRLPQKQRVVLILFYYHRFTVPEIAQILAVGENTLRKRLQSALGKIRRTLHEPASEGVMTIQEASQKKSVHIGKVFNP